MNFYRAEQIIKAFRQKKILVVGDFMLDEYVHGQVERISPEAPVPIVLSKKHSIFPGGAGNVVCNLHRLGAQVYLAGTVGEDEEAQSLKNSFFTLGLMSEQVGLQSIKGRPTTRKTRILAAKQQICRVDREVNSPFDFDALKELRSYIKEHIEQSAALIFSDYDKGLVIPELIKETLALSRKTNCIVAVDPQVSHFNYYHGVDLLTPNHHEAGSYLGQKLTEDKALSLAGLEILRRLDARLLLITRGEKGMSLFEKGKEDARHFPTQAREVFDVTGAGDTVISIFTLALSAKASTEEAVELANAGAGQVVRHVGAATLTPKELLKEVQNNTKGD